MILDNVDLKILDELQRDGALSNVTLAKRIGLSPSPCLARVKALESNGVIQRYVALASAAAPAAAAAKALRMKSRRPFLPWAKTSLMPLWVRKFSGAFCTLPEL
eukprot:gene28959-50864_t